MPHLSLSRRTVSAAAILAALSVPLASSAQGIPRDSEVSTGIVKVANAPIEVTACKFTHGVIQPEGNVVIANRTTHALANAQVVLVAYDNENTRMGQQTLALRPEQPIVTGESSTFHITTSLSGDLRLLGRITCRVQSAQFSANKHWTYGQRWPEKLLPLHTDTLSTSGGEGGAAGNPSRSAAAAPRLQIAVTNAWTDTVGGVTYVHDALSITGGDAPSSLRPSNLTLTVTLANGARKTYTGLEQPAPTYQKLNPLGSTPTTAYEVDPAADMGRIGALTIPPHGTVITTVTFAIPDPLAAGANYREVAVTR